MKKPLLRSRRGSALLLTLLVVSLLLVLVLGFVVFVRLHLREISNRQEQMEARQNARLGLALAIAQLQRHAGPDQRVTAPATTLLPAKDSSRGTGELFDRMRARAQTSRAQSFLNQGETFLTGAERADFEQDLQDWWNQDRHPRFLGVLDSSLRVDRASGPHLPPAPLAPERYEENPLTFFGEPNRRQLPVWLVSGNEFLPFDPAIDTVYPTGYVTPETPIPESDRILLVGTGSATASPHSADGLDGRVHAPRVEVRGSDNQTRGHYAWWVTDESLKSNFAVFDPYEGSAPGSTEYRNRLQVPQRLGWERMGAFASVSVDPNEPDFLKVASTLQIEHVLPGSAGENGPLRSSFHQMTRHSSSLLTNTALGGFKQDLTVFFEGSGGSIDSADPIPDPSRYRSDDSRFGELNQGFPTNPGSNLPTWGDAKRWHDSAVLSESGSVAVEPGRAPIHVQMKVDYGFTHRNGRIQFHLLPYFVLWNPWDSALAETTYTLRMRLPVHGWRAGFAQRADTYVDPSPASDHGGRKVGEFVIRPVRGIGAYNNAANFTNLSGTSGMTAVENHPNQMYNSSSGPSQYPTNPDTGLEYTDTELNSMLWPQYRLALTDLNPLDSVDSDRVTWIEYEFTDRFEAGQTKVFSMVGHSVEVPNGLQAIRDQEFKIPLQNDFDSDFPASAYWDFGEFLDLSAFGLGTPGSGDDIRFTFEPIARASSALQLYANGDLLWRVDNAGGVSSGFSATIVKSYLPGTGMRHSPLSAYRPLPTTWRIMHHLTTWLNDPGLPRGRNLEANDTPTFPRAFNYLQPLTPHGGNIHQVSSPGVSGYQNFYRAFANYNLSSGNVSLPVATDHWRGGFSSNNSDLSSKIDIYQGNNSDGYNSAWNRNQVNILPSGDAEGFAMLTWNETDSSQNLLGVSRLPIRAVRRANSQLLSLGQLQQANLSPNFWQPTFALGNSEATPYTDRNKIGGIEFYAMGALNGTENDAKRGPRANNPESEYLDLSYLLNENVWDRYFLSSIPSSGPLPDHLANSRHRVDPQAPVDELRELDLAAPHIRNIGALNVNSANVDVWRALLTAFRNLELQGSEDGLTNPPDSVPIPRSLAPQEGPVRYGLLPGERVQTDYGAVATNRDLTKMFRGFRFLSDVEIEALAERIVDEIRFRGPFFSMADFVNRRLVVPDGALTPNSPWRRARSENPLLGGNLSQLSPIGTAYRPLTGLQGLNGTLQRAINLSGINGGVNNPSPEPRDSVFSHWTGSSGPLHHHWIMSPNANWFLDSEHMAGAPVAESGQLFSHTPGTVTQGDLLALLGPALTARGDTFLIRAYGDSGAATGARAWLEAVVQRVPDPVDPAALTGPDRFRPVSRWGRRFEIVSLRWLLPEEI